MKSRQDRLEATDQDAVPRSGDRAAETFPTKELVGLFAAVLACATFGAFELLACDMTYCILYAPSSHGSMGNFLNDFVYGPLVFAFIALVKGGIVSSVVCCFVGIPVHLLLARRKLLGLRAYLLAGLLASAAVLIILLTVPGTRAPILSMAFYAVPDFSVCGPLAAGLFWFVVRPDKKFECPEP